MLFFELFSDMGTDILAEPMLVGLSACLADEHKVGTGARLVRRSRNGSFPCRAALEVYEIHISRQRFLGCVRFPYEVDC